MGQIVERFGVKRDNYQYVPDNKRHYKKYQEIIKENNKIDTFYRKELVPFLVETLGLTPVEGQDKMPYWRDPAACLGKNETVLLQPYQDAGHPITSIDVVFISNKDSEVKAKVLENFPFLKPVKSS